MFFYTGLRPAELADLDVADLSMSARRGRLRVRSGKGDAYREVPLNSALCGPCTRETARTPSKIQMMWLLVHGKRVRRVAYFSFFCSGNFDLVVLGPGRQLWCLSLAGKPHELVSLTRTSSVGWKERLCPV